MSLGLAISFENFQNFTCFRIFCFTLNSSTETNWYPSKSKCVPFALFNYLSLSYVIFALSSVVTILPSKTFIFHDFQEPTIKFHDLLGLENEIVKFHNFPGFLWPVWTLQEGVYRMNDFCCPLFLHFISHPPHKSKRGSRETWQLYKELWHHLCCKSCFYNGDDLLS